MCTLTIVRPPPAGGAAASGPASIRMACNRDESRSRPAALPPEIRAFGPRRAILPIDPVGGGTWIAVNDAGLAASLLNHYAAGSATEPGRRPAEGLASRGTIIPRLMPCGTTDAALAELRRLDPSVFPPFRLVLTDGIELIECVSNSRHVSCNRRPLGDGPVMFASSGLGDEVVDGPRRELFREMVVHGLDPVAGQDAYHRHSWPDRRRVSVCMSRAEARTVSYTVVETRADLVLLTYYGDSPDRPVIPVRLELPRTPR